MGLSNTIGLEEAISSMVSGIAAHSQQAGIVIVYPHTHSQSSYRKQLFTSIFN